jgi:hypothetical protein
MSTVCLVFGLCKYAMKSEMLYVCTGLFDLFEYQANYINALAVSVLPFFEPAMPMTLGGLFLTLGGFWYDIG